MRGRGTALAVAVAIVGLTPGARAEDEGGSDAWSFRSETPPAERTKDLGVRTHDGFYLRLAVGVGRLAFDIRGDTVFESVRGSATGFGTATEISVGGTVLPGLVLAGSIYGESVSSPTSNDMTSSGLRYAVQETFDDAVLASLGLLVDWYVDPKAGWHVEAAFSPRAGFHQGAFALGPTRPSGGEQDVAHDGPHTAFGPSIALGAGWEGFVGAEWSLGALLRFTYAHAKSNDDSGWSYDVVAFPSLLGTATFH